MKIKSIYYNPAGVLCTTIVKADNAMRARQKVLEMAGDKNDHEYCWEEMEVFFELGSCLCCGEELYVQVRDEFANFDYVLPSMVCDSCAEKLRNK